ncbi:MAG TPA: ribulose-phosphate 3-epimerase [Limnochordia bacterium]|nr:ribulose-phosphate 3-epimerase [Limnochordia bacterium]
MLIAPSILAADFAHLADAAASVAQADWLHVDVMDGRFVPNISFGPVVIEALARSTKLPLDVHLMIEEPERHLEAFAKAGAASLTVHAEASVHLHRTVQTIKALGLRAGVALNPATPLTAIEHILTDIDLVLLMTVNPGFGGQPFIAGMRPKIRAAASRLAAVGANALIEVDGGIDCNTAPECRRDGASVFVAGSAIFGPPDPQTNLARLRAALTA